MLIKHSFPDIKEGKVNYNESMETTHYSIVDQFWNAVSQLPH
jgi:gamma-glutamyltranspeptidase/glutathione hydrolase